MPPTPSHWDSRRRHLARRHGMPAPPKRVAMPKTKLPWLSVRLKELGKTKTGLARELNVPPPLVYELIGGRRQVQPDQVKPMARYLEWSTDELLARLDRAVDHKTKPVNDADVMDELIDRLLEDVIAVRRHWRRQRPGSSR
jgi:plasmid maintenance system antidote protein VapI